MYSTGIAAKRLTVRYCTVRSLHSLKAGVSRTRKILMLHRSNDQIPRRLARKDRRLARKDRFVAVADGCHTHSVFGMELYRWDLLLYDWNLAAWSQAPADDSVIIAIGGTKA